MFEGHDPYLVALSVAIAILGGYTGFGLTARIRGTPDAGHRVLLAGAAFFLAIGIWTMHFVGMLAAPLPPGTVYLVLPTIISFLICALVVGISLFFVSVGEPPISRVVSSAVLLGVGIASMHYVGMHGLSGDFAMTHDNAMVALSVAIAIAAAYGGLRAFLARQGGVQLALSAIAFGVAVSGMHYTAMDGMHLVPPSAGMHHHIEGLAASSQMLSLVVALLCFVIAAGFLLSLVPDSRRKAMAGCRDFACGGRGHSAGRCQRRATSPRLWPPARRPRPPPAARTAAARGGRRRPPLHRHRRYQNRAGGRTLYQGARRHPRADVPVVDLGSRSPTRPRHVSQGAPQPHRRDHHVTQVRKEDDAAIIELDGPSPLRIPVSRAKVAEVKAKLKQAKRHA